MIELEEIPVLLASMAVALDAQREQAFAVATIMHLLH